MVKHYEDTPWWWYVLVLVGSFVLGLIVVLKENITLPAWAYVVSLLLGVIFAHSVGILAHPSDRLTLTLCIYRASFSCLDMAMALLPITSQKCWPAC